MIHIALTAQSISLRLIDLSDLAAIHALHSLPETDRYNTLGIPKDLDETKHIITSWVAAHSATPITTYTFAIERATDQEFVGLIGLKLWPQKHRRGEIWYKIHPDHWRKGYATQSVNLVLDFGFDTLKLNRIQAGCAVANTGSIKVLEKVGMTREGRGRKVLPLKTGWSDNFEYSILDTDARGE